MPFATGDVSAVKNGEKIEGKLLEEYARERGKHPDSPEGHFAMARWCGRNGLTTRRAEHLRAALTLNSRYEPALRALGYVSVGEAWLKTGRKQSVLPQADAGGEKAKTPAKAEDEPADLLREAIAAWFLRVRAIYAAHLVVGGKAASGQSLEAGLEKLRSIRDPLAIPALAEVLANRHVVMRQVLVKTLGRFEEDEALMNLMVISLLDSHERVREEASARVAERKDPRVPEQLIEALRCENVNVLLNAAGALARLRVTEAVPHLVKVLKRTDDRTVRRLSLEQVLSGITKRFGAPRKVTLGDREVIYHPEIRVLGPNSPIGSLQAERAQGLYRSEVQEALIDITGVNHGFNADAWMLWYLQNVE